MELYASRSLLQVLAIFSALATLSASSQAQNANSLDLASNSPDRINTSGAPAIPANYTRYSLVLPGDIEQILLVDADADGLQDILTVSEKLISIYFQSEAGAAEFFVSSCRLELPVGAVGWDISYDYAPVGAKQNHDGSHSRNPPLSVIALIDGDTVKSWSIEDRRFSEPMLVHSELGGFLTRGTYRLQFSRDINSDGLDDLVIPGAESLRIFVRNPDGGFQPAIDIQTDMRLATSLSSRQLSGNVGQTLAIPLMRLRDVNNDGNPDLISRTNERLEVFLARKSDSSSDNAHYVDQVPSYVLDIAAIQERLGTFDSDDIDLSNLTGMLSITHQEILEDLNNDGIDDLLLREGGKISVFTGDENGMDFSKPKQILRSGGNVLSTFLYDENGDGLSDLWLWRVEPISVGDIFLWLTVSGSIKIDAFVYINDGEQFQRRPSRRITVTLKLPSGLSALKTAMDFEKQAIASGEVPVIPTAIANIDSFDASHDLLALLDDQVQIFLNAIEKREEIDEETQFLNYLDYSRSKDKYEIDLREIIKNISFARNAELQSVSGDEPDYRIPLDEIVEEGGIITAELNADGLDDVFIFLERSSVQIRGILLLSNK